MFLLFKIPSFFCNYQINWKVTHLFELNPEKKVHYALFYDHGVPKNMADALVYALAITILGNLHSLALEDIGVSEGLASAQLGYMVMGSPTATGH